LYIVCSATYILSNDDSLDPLVVLKCRELIQLWENEIILSTSLWDRPLTLQAKVYDYFCRGLQIMSNMIHNRGVHMSTSLKLVVN